MLVLVSFSVTTTPGSAGESKKALATRIERSEQKILYLKKLVAERKARLRAVGQTMRKKINSKRLETLAGTRPL